MVKDEPGTASVDSVTHSVTQVTSKDELQRQVPS
jgi:hypothetical protein